MGGFLFLIAVLSATTVRGTMLPTQTCGAVLMGGDVSEIPLLDAHSGLEIPIHHGSSDKELRAEAFAADQDAQAITILNRDRRGQSTIIKLHLITGEILISTLAGKLVLYQSLPVGVRPLANFKSAVEILEFLRGRVHSAENLGELHFVNEETRTQHFRKHVLWAAADETLSHWLNRRPKRSEFPGLQKAFRMAASTADEPLLGELSNQHAIDYEKRASAFAQSTSDTTVSIHIQVRFPDGGLRDLAWKLNTVTNELLLAALDQNRILTYHRLDPSVAIGNRQLAGRYRLPPVQTPFEYILSLAQAQSSEP